MKFSLRWLEEYIALDKPLSKVLDKLTMAGTEVEFVETKGVESQYLVVGQVLSFVPHPNADRLRLCQVLDGQGQRQIVCGAKNFKEGDKVPLALPGAELPGGFKIKESKLRGELSQGMLCSAKELALAEDAEGLLILPPEAPLGIPFHEYKPVNSVFSVEITPNRPDLLSYRGLARELAAIGMGQIRPTILPNLSQLSVGKDLPVSPWVVDILSDSCPFYSAVTLGGLRVAPSPDWLRERVEAMGFRSINNVVDVTNFVLWETGQPLHAFDAQKLKAPAIIVRQAMPEEKMLALDGKEYALKMQDLVIADERGAVAIAGVMGGSESCVTSATTEIVLESAWFLPGKVRHTSRRLGLMSESSYRFERRVDPAGVLTARDRAVQLILELAGGTVTSQPVIKGELPSGPLPVELRHERVEKVIGTPVSKEKVSAWLTSLGLSQSSDTSAKSLILAEGSDTTLWTIPSYRADLEREIDLIEEIARLHGLADIPARMTLGVTPESIPDRVDIKLRQLRKSLASRGFDECVTDVLVDKRVAGGVPSVELLNPLNEQYTHMRPNLRGVLLSVASRNLARGVKALRLFEVGRVYVPREAGAAHTAAAGVVDSAGFADEPVRLGILVGGEAEEAAWWQSQRGADFFDLKGVTDFLAAQAGLSSRDCLEALTVPPSVLKEYGIKTPVFYAEYALDAWLLKEETVPTFKALPAFPAVRRDIAVVTDLSVTHEDVQNTILSAKVTALEHILLFDIFTDAKGEKIAADKKSLAYGLTYRANDRTLTEKEVSVWHEQVKARLQKTLNCTFRE
ncbi:MAG: phenylalanine--tRNA ligase subunit beta [Candidatus Methylacidiphilales bacterium]|nr:phenylalanine--tRNA ligase subunit beta [Candidatus Methylacidiphilales bacterium]